MHNEERRDSLLEQSRQLVAALEAGNDEAAEEMLALMSSERETELFQEVGKLTRQLHDNLNSFTAADNLSELTEKEIPDAKERLNFVIKMTDDAAHATLNAIDEILPVSDDLSERSEDLQQKWNRFTAREMPLDEFKTMAHEITDYLNASTTGANTIHSKLNEVVMAQGFQDLTGQVIRKVIKLVQEVEGSLVELIRISKSNPNQAKTKVDEDERAKLEGPAVPGIEVDGAVNSQDEVDDLLSSLGF